MKVLSNGLVVLFGGKCLVNFMIGEGTIADGLFLIAVVVYCFTLLDLKLPVDK